MARAELEKIKLKLILKSYILCNENTTCKDLTQFVNDNFNFLTTITSYKISSLLKDNKHGILTGLKSKKKYLKK